MKKLPTVIGVLLVVLIIIGGVILYWERNREELKLKITNTPQNKQTDLIEKIEIVKSPYLKISKDQVIALSGAKTLISQLTIENEKPDPEVLARLEKDFNTKLSTPASMASIFVVGGTYKAFDGKSLTLKRNEQDLTVNIASVSGSRVYIRENENFYITSLTLDGLYYSGRLSRFAADGDLVLVTEVKEGSGHKLSGRNVIIYK